MASLQWALPCSKVITDRDTNSISYLEIAEAFRVKRLPIRFPPISIATHWRCEELGEILKVRIRIQDPNGKLVLKFEPDEPAQTKSMTHRVNFLVGGIEVKVPGEYKIIVEQNRNNRWKRESTLAIDILSADTEQDKALSEE